jgi:hypothetical protein
MKTQHKTVTQSTCLPPEAYIHLWNAAAKRSIFPKYQSTTYPNGWTLQNSLVLEKNNDFISEEIV